MGQERILVIEDDGAVRRLIADMLGEAGYEVVCAADGREGLQRFGEAPVALVITDLFMPEMDGLEVLHELRRLAPAARILAVSGGAAELPLDLLGASARLGAAAVLRKPFTSDELLAAVTRVLRA